MSSKLLVIGAGGHARSILDIALQNGDYSDISCIDATYPETVCVKGLEKIPVIGSDTDMDSLYSRGYRHIITAIGDNKLRHRLYHNAISIGFEPVNIISRHAVMSARVQLGKGICIMPGAVININTVIGDNCIINTCCSIDHDCHIMESSHVAPGVTLSGCVQVRTGAWVGTGASVIENISIGEWSYIGAGAAVVNDVEPNVLCCGVPARKIKHL